MASSSAQTQFALQGIIKVTDGDAGHGNSCNHCNHISHCKRIGKFRPAQRGIAFLKRYSAPLFPPGRNGLRPAHRHLSKTFCCNCPGTPPNRCRTELLSDERFGFVHDTIHICSRLSRRPSRIEASSKLKKRGTWAVTAKRNTPKKAWKFKHLKPPLRSGPVT